MGEQYREASRRQPACRGDEEQRQLERQQDPTNAGDRTATLEPCLACAGDGTSAPLPQDPRPVEPSEGLPSVGHVAAAGPCDLEAGDKIREGNVRHEDRQHDRLGGFELERHHHGRIDHDQP